MPRSRVLLCIEATLVVVGVALAVWSAATLMEARRTRSLPIEPVRVTMARAAPERGTVIGRIDIPSLQISTPVLEGTDDETLRRGSGHIEDTPFPGEPGNIGIAGHRDTIFRPLRRLRIGDVLNLATSDHVYRYRVAKTMIVGPGDVYVLDPTTDPTLTLVTCYPFDFIGHAPKRYIVRAELIRAP